MWLGLLILLFVVGALVWGLVTVRRPVPESTPPPPAETEPKRDKLETLAIEGNSEGLWHWDLLSNKLRVSNGWAEILGYKADDIGQAPEDWFAMVHPYYVSGLRMDLSAHLSGQKHQLECEYRIRHRDGTYRWVLCRGQAVRDEHGKATEIAGVQTDVTRLIEVEHRLVQEALHDRLTGLPNRNYFSARLKQVVESCRLDSRYRFAVLFLDLDRFKEINDTLGHLVGDELLASVAGRLQGCLRADDFLARFGGDEFVVLLDPLSDVKVANEVASRIHKSVSSPFHLEGHQVITQASIGIALSETGFKDTEELMRNADIAMYAAKAEGKGQTKIYLPKMYERTQRNWEIENELRKAVERQELVLHYQPQICLKTGKIRGAEALVRWRRADGQTVSPGEFIPVAEKSDLILQIGEWVLRRACEEAKSWGQLEAVSPEMPTVSVNLSARQINQPGFPMLLSRILDETGFDPAHLELELTETVLLDSLEKGSRILDDISRRGVSIAIDDFGTGYSSMSYLRKLTADVIKLDRSFLADIRRDSRAAALAKGMISLCHDLELTVLAEGVEKAEQLEFLRSHGCDFVQGFFTSLPVPPERFRELLLEDRNLASPGLAAMKIDPLPGRNEVTTVQ